jgi:hypothetical protein
LKPIQEKKSQPGTCSPTPSPTLGTKNSNILLASPKRKKLSLLGACCNSSSAE